MKSWSSHSIFCLASSAAVVVTVPGFAATYLDLEEAQKVSFEEATHFEKAHVFFTDEQKQSIQERSGQKVRTKGQQVWKAWRDEDFLGFFVLDYVIGKHELIDYVIAIEPQGAVKQVEILKYRESYGYEVRSRGWRKQFQGKTVKDSLRIHDDIYNIGGATLSCRHVTEGVKKVLAIYETILKNN